MCVVAVVSFAGGVVFFLVGAWPVGFFFGLDALLIYWAFRVNYRAAEAYEQVTVTPSELRVRKVTHQRQGLGMVAQSAVDAARPRNA